MTEGAMNLKFWPKVASKSSSESKEFNDISCSYFTSFSFAMGSSIAVLGGGAMYSPYMSIFKEPYSLTGGSYIIHTSFTFPSVPFIFGAATFFVLF